MPFLWVLIPFMLLICIISFSVIGSFIWLDLWVCGFHCGLSVRGIVRVRAMGVPSVLSFCSPMVHRPKLLCWDKRLWQRINEFIENKCVFILGFQSEIWNDVAMKLLFSRINEERTLAFSGNQKLCDNFRSNVPKTVPKILPIQFRLLNGRVIDGVSCVHSLCTAAALISICSPTLPMDSQKC